MKESSLVLVIDDEPQIRRLLRISLEANNYCVIEADSGQTALVQAAQHRADVIVLDLNLPDMEGVEVLRRLREWTTTPVIMLSVRASDADKVSAFDAGADDYLTKPFSTVELLARLRVALRHAQGTAPEQVLHVGDVQIDLARRIVTRKNEPVKLTPTEYALLRLLAQNTGRVLTHRQLLKEVWGPQYVDKTQYLRVYFGQLRQKLEENPAMPQLILTEPGIGYRLIAG